MGTRVTIVLFAVLGVLGGKLRLFGTEGTPGTQTGMVIAAPKTALRIDLASAGASGDLRFTTAQLDAYGIKELHVLEEVLHGSDRRTQREVAERIQRKIGWPAPFEGTPRAFLQAYYAGLRDRLEQRMVTTGKRRADKFDR